MSRLRDLDFRVYSVFTFMPNTIYRMAAIDSAALVDGYRYIQHLYPMFPFVRRLVERDEPVHVPRTMLVRRRGVTVPVSPMYWFLRWVRCASTIPEDQDRRYLIWSTAPGRIAWMKSTGATILQEKLYRPDALGPELRELLALLQGRQRLAFLALTPLALVPTSVLAPRQAAHQGRGGRPAVRGRRAGRGARGRVTRKGLVPPALASACAEGGDVRGDRRDRAGSGAWRSTCSRASRAEAFGRRVTAHAGRPRHGRGGRRRARPARALGELEPADTLLHFAFVTRRDLPPASSTPSSARTSRSPRPSSARSPPGRSAGSW